jgi:chromosome segregation ATPase
MEIEQIIKQLDWLDDERRKDKTRLAALEERLAAQENNLLPVPGQIKDLGSELNRLQAVLARLDQVDEANRQMRMEAKQYFDELERQFKKREDEAAKSRMVEMRALDSTIADLRKDLEPIPEFKRNLKVRVDEEARLGRMLDELRGKLDLAKRNEEEITRSYRLIEDGRRQDVKRLTDLQGEVAALRKRADEMRGQVDLNLTAIKKNETRTNELTVIDTDRREAMQAFADKQALFQVERERAWKEWEARFVLIETQTAEVEANLQAMDATHRAVIRSQAAVEELSQKVERRIGEFTEIQRLAEERFRQEWVTFKADDQKRWTNYTLTMDEQRNEVLRQNEKLVEKVTEIEDNLQDAQDLLQQINEQTEKRLQALLAVAHEWATTFDRSVGRNR